MFLLYMRENGFLWLHKVGLQSVFLFLCSDGSLYFKTWTLFVYEYIERAKVKDIYTALCSQEQFLCGYIDLLLRAF